MSDKAQFDPYVTGERRSVDQSSPVAYVRGFLSRRIRVLLADGVRQIVGIFVALDHTGTLTLRDGIEMFEGHERPLGFVLITLPQVQSMELAE
jgi:small nuclear ribonucleoprotein (snRNP)-like protein